MAVRFRMGHLKPLEAGSVHMDRLVKNQRPASNNFVWTYVSPEFQMTQENCLQKFKLPEPVLCIGGILQIELLGRVQKQDTDGLFYICVSHVQVIGCSVSPAFDVEILDPSGKWLLKYYPEA
uniref:Uncharacterized protein n=1 Tax=Nelumbo nucifera TaxID=4432 RepID=A0A822XJ49_NELNU|nr:TPA_asm: hypothetical protein HUJ06_020258 [Nelumbo nucifera]